MENEQRELQARTRTRWIVIGAWVWLSACSAGEVHEAQPGVGDPAVSQVRVTQDPAGDGDEDPSDPGPWDPSDPGSWNPSEPSDPGGDPSDPGEPPADPSEPEYPDAGVDAGESVPGSDPWNPWDNPDGGIDGGDLNDPLAPRTNVDNTDPCTTTEPSYTALATTTGWGRFAAPYLTGWSAAIAGDHLCVQISGAIAGRNWNLYLQTDDDPTTGLEALQKWPISGSDYVVSGATVFKATGQAWSGLQQIPGVQATQPIGAADLTISVPLSSAEGQGVYAPSPSSIKLGFEVLNASFSADDYLPRGGDLAPLGGGIANVPSSTTACSAVSEYAPSTCPKTGGGTAFSGNGNLAPPIAITRGMIVPAYLTLGEKANNAAKWGLLRDGAAKAAGMDYIVVVNGSNGPVRNDLWKAAEDFYEPIRTNGGHIFGYVHTADSYQDPVTRAFIVPPQFRTLAKVEEEITTWVCNYPSLDGIWIDEFNPRFEVATSSEATPSLPNGDALRPSDPRLTQGMDSNAFNSLSIDPHCGYFDRLTSWIRRTYPHLRIIGNAGASLRGNQRRYATLVDVIAGYESSLANAEQNNWTPLANGVEPLAYANLAMLHAGDPGSALPSSTRAQGITAALSENLYSHVYATDNLHGGNLWGDLPVDALGSAPRLDPTDDAASASSKSLLAEVTDILSKR